MRPDSRRGACVGTRSCPVPQHELSLLHCWNSVEVTGPMGKCRPLMRWSVSNSTQVCVVDAHFVARVRDVSDCFLLPREKKS